MRIDLTKIPSTPPKGTGKKEIQKKTKKLLSELEDLQHVLYAQSKYSLLIVFQGMDASGKDGATRNVLGACNPQGVRVTSFKVPTKEELAHDFLWRIHKHTPEKGMIQVFNRSHYEDVLVVRMLGYCDEKKAKERFELINSFEKLIEHNDTKILKFYLHISEDAQLKNLQARIDNPKKQWKHNPGDWEMRKKWPEFREYYQDCFEFCGPDIPWIIVPTDEKWYKEYLVAKHVVDALKSFDLKLPGLPDES